VTTAEALGHALLELAEDPGTPPALTREETHDHAAELLRALTEHAGDPPAVNATMLRWLDAHDVQQMSFISMAALALAFGECMHRRPLAEIPPGSLTVTPPAPQREVNEDR